MPVQPQNDPTYQRGDERLRQAASAQIGAYAGTTGLVESNYQDLNTASSAASTSSYQSLHTVDPNNVAAGSQYQFSPSTQGYVGAVDMGGGGGGSSSSSAAASTSQYSRIHAASN